MTSIVSPKVDEDVLKGIKWTRCISIGRTVIAILLGLIAGFIIFNDPEMYSLIILGVVAISYGVGEYSFGKMVGSQVRYAYWTGRKDSSEESLAEMNKIVDAVDEVTRLRKKDTNE